MRGQEGPQQVAPAAAAQAVQAAALAGQGDGGQAGAQQQHGGPGRAGEAPVRRHRDEALAGIAAVGVHQDRFRTRVPDPGPLPRREIGEFGQGSQLRRKQVHLPIDPVQQEFRAGLRQHVCRDHLKDRPRQSPRLHQLQTTLVVVEAQDPAVIEGAHDRAGAGDRVAPGVDGPAGRPQVRDRQGVAAGAGEHRHLIREVRMLGGGGRNHFRSAVAVQVADCREHVGEVRSQPALPEQAAGGVHHHQPTLVVAAPAHGLRVEVVPRTLAADEFRPPIPVEVRHHMVHQVGGPGEGPDQVPVPGIDGQQPPRQLVVPGGSRSHDQRVAGPGSTPATSYSPSQIPSGRRSRPTGNSTSSTIRSARTSSTQSRCRVPAALRAVASTSGRPSRSRSAAIDAQTRPPGATNSGGRLNWGRGCGRCRHSGKGPAVRFDSRRRVR